MIIYFSSTGNCKFIAEKLAEGLNDKAVALTCISNIHLNDGEKLGFVFPTYFWRLPSVVTEHLKKLCITVDGDPYIYFISTFGTTCGGTGYFMKKHLKAMGFRLSLALSIKTVDDWTVWFDTTDKSKIDCILSEEKSQINTALKLIKSGATGNKMKNTLPMIAVLGSNVFYNKARKTKHLNVNENCISCGLCERECPTLAIELQNGRPVWVKEKCAMCLHCLHFCPEFAINYDNKTQNHGQYRHPL